jgi:DNA-binding response OmpR family regulator
MAECLSAAASKGVAAAPTGETLTLAKSTRILVAEDDHDIAQLIAHYVQRAGWLVHIAESGDEALAYARSESVDVVVLDLMLPGMNGLEVCRSLRADRATARLPIIMVTARAEESDRIFGLDLGADDYLGKPFSPHELIARIRAVMRRSRPDEAGESVLRYGPLRMDVLHHSVTDDDREVKLTAKEFMLLQYLLQHRGRVLSRDLLLGDVWGYSYTGGTRTVDVHVRRLREKLPILVDGLVTVKQFGYKLGDAAGQQP